MLKNKYKTMEAHSNYYRNLEFSEALYWSKLYSQNTKLKTYQKELAGGIACALPEIDILAFNRVVGIGLGQAVDEKDLDAVIEFFEQAGSRRFFLQASPYLEPDLSFEEMLSSKGFQYHNNWIKLAMPLVEEVDKIANASNLTIRSVTKNEAAEYGRLIVNAFDWTEKLSDLFASSVGKDGYIHYFAVLDGKPIAAAALHMQGQFASMAIAGTLPEFRGMGAQKQLLTQRLRDAKKMGCKYAITETGENLPARPNFSYQNMLKVGFKPEYIRKNFLFQF